MELDKLIIGREIKKLAALPNIEISNLCCDLSDVTTGSMFFCFEGSKVDSHTLAEEAERRGAAVIVCERDTLASSYVIVKNSRAIMAIAAGRFYGSPANDIKIISVVGTNGKTTTAHMIYSILNYAKIKCGLIGTTGIFIGKNKLPNNMTTPDPIELHRVLAEMRDNKIKVVVMEVSAHAIALHKMTGIKAELAVFTNFSQDHLDYFKTMSRYKRAKTSYFTPQNIGSAVLNFDDSVGREIADSCNVEVASYAIDSAADFTAINISQAIGKTEYNLLHCSALRGVETCYSGKFNVYNALAATVAATKLGIDLDIIVAALASIDCVCGRFNVIKLRSGATAIVDFAHTPDGLSSVLKTARELSPSKLISVFGCGGNRDKIKRPIMAEIATELCDLTILTSDNPRYENPEDIILDMQKGVKKDSYYIAITDRAKAIEYATSCAGSGDIVVIAGKGHEDYQEINGKKQHFSDSEEVAKFID